MIKRSALAVLLALTLSACWKSEPPPPVKRTSMNDVMAGLSGLFARPKLKPVPEVPQPSEPEFVPVPVFVPLPRPSPAPHVAALPVQPVPALAAKPKPAPKPQEPKKKAKPAQPNGVAGYSCATLRRAGSAANVEFMATAQGHVVTDEIRRQIAACFPKG